MLSIRANASVLLHSVYGATADIPWLLGRETRVISVNDNRSSNQIAIENPIKENILTKYTSIKTTEERHSL